MIRQQRFVPLGKGVVQMKYIIIFIFIKKCIWLILEIVKEWHLFQMGIMFFLIFLHFAHHFDLKYPLFQTRTMNQN